MTRHPLLVLADELLASREREPEVSPSRVDCAKCGAWPDEPCWNATVEGGICIRRSA